VNKFTKDYARDLLLLLLGPLQCQPLGSLLDQRVNDKFDTTGIQNPGPASKHSSKNN